MSRPRFFPLFVAFGSTLGCGVYDYQLASSMAASGSGGAAAGGAKGEAGSGERGGEAGAPTSPNPDLVGWAAVTECGPRGATGGELGPTVRPETVEELADAVREAGPSVIEISGQLELGDVVLQVSSDKTLVGVDEAELLGNVRVLGAENVILRNLKIDGATGAVDRDALEIDGSTCVWVDHCEIFDGGDSNIDIVRGSDLVTVSWSKFYYVAKTDDHRLGSVCGNSNSDTPGRINVTFHHNWWADGLQLNMPSVRHGKVHIFNNYFSSAGNEYCISAGYMARLLVQNNVFDGVNSPIVFGTDEDTAEVVEAGNDYEKATGTHVSRGVAFEPPYPFSLDATSPLAGVVRAEAGAR